jgi:DNA-binding transcriptional MerR regulator
MATYMTRFQIRDLEEFSGVKAHTIRMWEKRYSLLEPDRTDTNIRYYGMDELKTILNVSYLNQNGLKISAIAAMSPAQREREVQSLASKLQNGGNELNSLKLAMVSYDEPLFERTSDAYAASFGFRALVQRIYVPLLEHIGVLWQTNSICPAQEHFVSNIIRNKLIVATQALSLPVDEDAPTYVLYLPLDEIHELGLLYLNYILRSQGGRTIYLGQSVPQEDLQQVAATIAGPVTFVSVLMAKPAPAEVQEFLEELRKALPEERISFLLTGHQLTRAGELKVPNGMRLHPSMASVIKALDAD